MSPSTKLLATPQKSVTDEKEYRALQLHNGLRVLLIADTRIGFKNLTANPDQDANKNAINDLEVSEKSSTGEKLSAAGLCVGIGSFSDPEELQGLAHFLEHMVFMGSKKYPDENGFDKFTADHGGYSNAHTHNEKTVYHFEIQREDFKEGLDQFAQFFIEPLLRKESMTREREAVNCEFQMQMPVDSSRIYQICQGLAKEGHPGKKFSWGNLESLQMKNAAGESDDNRCHGVLCEFKDRHYTAGTMTLVVQSQHELDRLQEWVEDIFGHVPNNSLSRETFGHISEPFGTPNFNRIYKVCPVKNVYKLNLNWALQPLIKEYPTKPIVYLSSLIGHEGEGSLISFLRKKFWALSIKAGASCTDLITDLDSTCSFFTVSIKLTKSGHKHIGEVLNAVFSYLKMLKERGPNERIFLELQKIQDLAFNFGNEAQPMDNAELLCTGMQDLPPEHYMTGIHLMTDYNPDLIKGLIDSLNEDTVNIFLLAPDYKDLNGKTEPWFKTNYFDEEIPSDWKKSWKNTGIFPEFFLPTDNLFIADATSLKQPPSGKKLDPYPVRIVNESDGELFHRMDDVFKQPRGILYFRLSSPLIGASIENAVCLDLLVACLKQQMIEDVYPAKLAMLEYEFEANECGIILKLDGLNDKLARLLETILSSFSRFESRLTDDLFGVVHDQTAKDYHNQFIDPMTLMKELGLYVQQDVYHTSQQKHQYIRDVTKNKACEFARKLFSTGFFIQGLVQGNFTFDEAVDIYNTARNCLGPRDYPMTRVAKQRCNTISPGSTYVQVNSFNPKDTNSAITNYYQDQPGNLQRHVYLEVGCTLLEEPTFNTLRTQEQLGYWVFSKLRNLFGVLGVSITVNPQANKFTLDHVNERIEAFVDWFVGVKLADLSDSDFNQVVKSIIRAKKTADVTLKDEADRNWEEILSGDYLFNRRSREIGLLKSCQKDSMVQFMTRFLQRDASRRKLSVQVVGNAEASEAVANVSDTFELSYSVPNNKILPSDVFVTDIDTFKESLQTYPELHLVD